MSRPRAWRERRERKAAPEVVEAVSPAEQWDALKCPECWCRSSSVIDQPSATGRFEKSKQRRCHNCKAVWETPDAD